MKVKIKEYASFDEFEQDESRQDYELVAVVNKKNAVCADLMTECKLWMTAVDRFFKALEGDDRFDGWKDCIIESIENGCWNDASRIWEDGKLKYTGDYSWGVEDHDGSWYVFLNVAVEEDHSMKLTEDEKRTVLAVFGELLRKTTSELNTFLGSITIQEMQRLYQKMKYDDYCKSRGIDYEEMTEQDFVNAYLSENED